MPILSEATFFESGKLLVAHRGQLQTNVYWCKEIYVDVNKYISMQKE